MKAQIKTDLTTAMKSGDKSLTQVLRMLLSEIMVGETAQEKQKFTSEQAVKRYFKRLQETKAVAPSSDLDAEIAIVERYMPKVATRQEVEAFVTTLDVSAPFGDLMKAVKGALPHADGKVTSEIVKAFQARK